MRIRTLFPILIIIGSLCFLLMKSQKEPRTNSNGVASNFQTDSLENIPQDVTRLLNEFPDEGFKGQIGSELAAENIWFTNDPRPDVTIAPVQFGLMTIEGQPERPYIMIHPNGWFNPIVSTQMKQLSLYHEFQHYLQWKSKNWDEEIFKLGKVSRFNENQLRQYVFIEFDASLDEYHMARKLGWTHINYLYEMFDRSGDDGVLQMVCFAFNKIHSIPQEQMERFRKEYQQSHPPPHP